MSHRSKTVPVPRTPTGKRRCPWCRTSVTLRGGYVPTHIIGYGTIGRCPASGKPYVSRRRRNPGPPNPLLPFTDGGMK